jgi:heme exporter protein A
MLEVRSLSCRRAMRLVLRDVAFRLAPGGAMLVMGANGSGKSTLLRLLAGLLPTHGGDILWQDKVITKDMAAHSARLRYLGHLDAVKPALTGGEMLDYWQALGISTVPEAFGITSLLSRPIRTLSAGQKRRLSLSRLSFDAPLWLLDEPSAALDADGQAMLIDHIEKHRAAGGMAVIATHDRLDLRNAENLGLS